MASILSLVLSKQLSVEDIVQWLSCHVYKENTKEILEPLECERLEFLPFFLNYLREQTSNLVQSSQASGLTPKKALQNQVQGANKSSSAHRETPHKTPTSRAKLFPAPGFPNADHRPQSRSPVFNRKVGNAKQVASHDGNAKAFAHSERKFNLGQFINSNSYVPADGLQRRKTNQRSPIHAQITSASVLDTPKRTQNLNLNDMELFPPVADSQLKTKDKRRISPIAISVAKTKTDDNFAKHFSTPFEKEAKDLKIQEVTDKCEDNVLCIENKTNDKKAKNFNKMQSVVSSAKLVEARIDDVTFKQELDILCELYCALIDDNLVPNLSVELYFLVQLLTVRHNTGKVIKSGKSGNVLCTVHNCVYFSVQVLHNQRRLLNLLDKATLRILMNNPRIAIFSASLKNYLNDIEKIDNHVASSTCKQNSIGSVAFQCDTDNRNNFPDDQTFQIFRKQRDEFYAILREWENNNLTPDWSMSVALGKRIHNIICEKSDPSLYYHLARLFLNQLIAMCKGDTSEDQKDDVFNDLQLLTDFKRTNPEKFKRLQERFIKPFQMKGPSPAPSFSGPQEFFCEFIVLANCHDFNQHVIDNLVSQILQLNEIEVQLAEHENDSFKEQFSSTLMTVRTLAKFLGFLVFAPYKNIERSPQDLQRNNIAMRNKVPFVLDLNALLKEAVAHSKLTLTVPWLVEFLSMMDANAALLNHIREVLISLVYLYRSSLLQMKREKLSLNNLLLLLLLGWLFEIHSISSTIFFIEVFTTNEILLSLDDSNSNVCLDSLDLVDHNILYLCCPYLRELKFVLTDFATGMNNRSSSIKKIVPIAADEHEKPSLSIRHLEEQLEENFFHNQPVSLRKTVEFVSERMASNVIKYVKKVIIIDVRKIGYAKIYEEFLSELANKERVKKRLFTLKEDVSMEMCNLVKTKTNETLERICCEKIEPTLKLLLAEDVTDGVFTACSQITQRLSRQKVIQWISTYVVPNLFVEEVQNEIERYKKQNILSPGKTPVFHSPVSSSQALSSEYALYSPTDMFIRIKSYVRDLYVGKAQKPEDIDEFLKGINLLMLPVAESNECLGKPVIQLSVEYAFGLVYSTPELMMEDTLPSFISFWQDHTESECFAGLICSRNVLYLQSSVKPNESWAKYEWLLCTMLSEELIKLNLFVENCFVVLKQKFPQNTFAHLLRCLTNIVGKYHCRQLKELKTFIFSFKAGSET